MSNIDNLRLKGANAKTANVRLLQETICLL